MSSPETSTHFLLHVLNRAHTALGHGRMLLQSGLPELRGVWDADEALEGVCGEDGGQVQPQGMVVLVLSVFVREIMMSFWMTFGKSRSKPSL